VRTVLDSVGPERRINTVPSARLTAPARTIAAPPESVARSVARCHLDNHPDADKPDDGTDRAGRRELFVAEQTAGQQRREDRDERKEDRADTACDRPLAEEQQPVCEADRKDAGSENPYEVAGGTWDEISPVVGSEDVAAKDEGREIEPHRNKQQRRHVSESSLCRDKRPAEEHTDREKGRCPAVIAQFHRASGT